MLRYETIQSIEQLHQQRLQKPHADGRVWQRLWKQASTAVRLLAVFSVLSLVLIEFADSIFGLNINALPPSGFLLQFTLLYLLPIFVLLPTTTIFYIRLLITTLTLSVDSIAREKEAGTWDFLTLSNMNARSLIVGKVMATFRTTFREYLLLSVLRIGVVTWFGLTMSRMYLDILPRFEVWSQRLEIPPEPQYLLIACAAIPVLTLLSGLFTIICGVLTALFVKRSYFWMTWVLRTAILIALFFVINTAANTYFARVIEARTTRVDADWTTAQLYEYDSEMMRSSDWIIGMTLSYTSVSFLDNGTQASTLLIGFMPFHVGQHSYLLATLVLVPLIYLLMIGVLLWITVTVARGQGM